MKHIESLTKLAEILSSKEVRLNNLYKIINKDSLLIDFKLNWMQQELFNNDHPRLINLKARQIGSTTYFAINFLDEALFKPNQNIHITSLSQESGEKIFNRIIKNAYNSLPLFLKKAVPVVRERTKGFEFANGSCISVDTSARSSTITHLLCTEFGKVCARYPQKAEEIITGSINAVPKGAKVVIESTAEGSSGYFFDLCQKSMRLDLKKLAKSQYKFFFFPWWREPDYIETDRNILIPKRLKEYFEGLEKQHGIILTDDQKRFYVIKYFENEEKVKQEFPSICNEAFLASSEGFWYQTQMYELRTQGKVCEVLYQKNLPVHTAWDLGYNDPTSIWFFQTLPNGTVNIIDYYENTGEGLPHYARILQDKGYLYGNHFVPHDAASHEKSGLTYVMQGEELGLEMIVMKRKNPMLGINNVRQLLSLCYFDLNNCEAGILSLEAYKKKWNERMQCYSSEAVHDKASHACDAMRCLSDGINYMRYGDTTDEEVEEIRNREIRHKLMKVY